MLFFDSTLLFLTSVSMAQTETALQNNEVGSRPERFDIRLIKQSSPGNSALLPRAGHELE
jgi:hypothetical protein